MHAVLALTTLAALLVGTATPAAAERAYGTLSARPGHDAYSTELTLIGTFPMSQERAQEIVSGTQRISIALYYWGDDPYWDDLLAVRYKRPNTSSNPTYLSVTDEGLGVYNRDDLDTAELNEDVEGRDEIYVEVILGVGGRTVARFSTYPITGYF